MENPSGSSTHNTVTDQTEQNPLPPKNPFHFTFPLHANHTSGSTIASSQSISKPKEGAVHHHRASSDSFLIEQPSWLEELLKEPDSPVHRGHRRSSSDSAAFFGSAADSFRTQGGRTSKAIVKQNQQESEGSSGKQNCSTNATCASRTDSKRSKQQYAQRSRLRKLQYIAELERSVHILQAEGFQVSATVEYLDQQVLILGMENHALKQRLDGLSQEQLIKQMEQTMLEREIAGLHFLYHQQQNQKQKHSTHQQTDNRELESQLANLSI